MNSCSHSGKSEHNGSPGSVLCLRFSLVLDFWLAWSTVFTDLAIQHVYLTQILDKNLTNTSHPVLQSVCRLTKPWLVR